MKIPRNYICPQTIRTSTKKAYPHLKFADLDSIMIQSFLTACKDQELTKTVLSLNIREFQKVVEVATRLALSDGPIDTKKSKPPIAHFNEQRQQSELEEATLAKISNIVITKVDEALKSRSRSRDKRQNNNNREDLPSNNSVKTQGYSNNKSDNPNTRSDYSINRRDNSNQRRDYSGNRRDHSANRGRPSSTNRPNSYSRDRGQDGSSDPRGAASQQQRRPRSSSRNRACFKCHGMGHFVHECTSTHWYKHDGTVDEERDRLQEKMSKNA